jgi:nucleotide-binding universal stress UspA family protein
MYIRRSIGDCSGKLRFGKRLDMLCIRLYRTLCRNDGHQIRRLSLPIDALILKGGCRAMLRSEIPHTSRRIMLPWTDSYQTSYQTHQHFCYRSNIMLRSILIGLDGSVFGSAAVELGIRWSRRFDALLVGIGIVDEPTICRPEPVAIGAGGYKLERDQELLVDAHRRVEDILEQFVRRCDEQGVKCRVLHDIGLPYTPILKESRQYDLIMLGQQTFFHFETQDWPDETLRQVLRYASRPVVTAPDMPPAEGCVLVAYDGSLQADRALQAFRALGLHGGDLVHVLSIDPDRAVAARLAEQAVEFLKLHDIEAVACPLSPDYSVSKMILSQARELQARLLVMGAYGRSMWREYVFGSTTSDILGASQSPLFLCH